MKVIIKDDEVFEKAHQEYESFTRDDRMREVYEAREKALKDYNTGIAHAEKRGIEKGRQEGRQEGLHQARLEDARRMLALGAEIDFVKKVTGLSTDEIEGAR